MIRNISLYKYLLIFIFICSNLCAQKFLPLEAGNRWDYLIEPCEVPHLCSEPFYYTESISKDTLMSNGKQYYCGISIGYKNTIRVDTNWVFLYYPNLENSDVPIMNFNSEVGDTHHIKENSELLYWFTTLEEKDTVELFGTITTILKYKYLEGVTEETISFSDKFGIIEIIEEYDFGYSISRLQGAIVSDTIYGNLTSLSDGLYDEKINYNLEQNYPNPFNPVTKIVFTIPKTEYVKLKIFNLLGEEVTSLIDGIIFSGTHQIDFNATMLSSGVYLYTIIAGNFIKTKKLIYLR